MPMLIFIILLLTFTTLAENGFPYETNVLEKLESWNDIDEYDDDIDFFDITSLERDGDRGNKILVNVDSLGAVGDGVSDDTKAFVDAWNKACSTPKSVFLVPQGRSYLVNATKFKGPCADRLTIQIDGTIIAPNDPNSWDLKFQRTWLEFSNISRVIIQGGGVIDGSGQKWWDASCKKNKSNPCNGAPTAMTIELSSAIRVKGLTFKNSQQMHFVISKSDSIRVTGVTVSSPEDSPNTDGIHITESTNVMLQNCKIGTGDDCISIISGSSNIRMKSIDCGPGHGISIGSIGKDNSTGIVTRVVLDTAYLHGTTNGLRIKTWQGGSGYVRAVRYKDVKMDDVAYPIIIDQFYCDSPTTCQNQTSAVEISQIIYENISGTSKTQAAMKFACSDTVPCHDIVLKDINLQSKDGVAEAYCNSAIGFGYGTVQPSVECLDSDKKLVIIHKEEEEVDYNDSILHTEL